MSNTITAPNPAYLRLRKVGLIGTLLLLPFESARVVAEFDGLAPGYNRLTTVFLFDVMLVALIVGAIPGLWSRWRRYQTLGVLIGSSLLAFAALALIVHPSIRGVMVVFRLFAVVVLTLEILSLTKEQFRGRVAIPLMATASLQTLIGMAQLINGGPLGLHALGERTVLQPFGDTLGAGGTTLHPYVLAGLGVLAATVGLATLPRDGRRHWWLAGIGLSAASLGITYSRSAMVGVVVALAALGFAVLRGRTDLRAPLAVLVVALVLPAVIFNEGWMVRAEESTTVDLDNLTTHRVTHIKQSLTLIGDAPLTGVGPGLYTFALERDHDPEQIDAVHVVPLLVAAENGVVAGAIITVLLLLLLIRAFRTSPIAVAVAAGFGAFLLFDKFAYLHPNGMVMFAVWLATLDRLWLQAKAPSTPS